MGADRDPVQNALEIYALRGSAYERVAGLGEQEEEISPTLPGLTFPAACVFAE